MIFPINHPSSRLHPGRKLAAISTNSESQESLFQRRVSTRLPDAVRGQHLAFGCIADDGRYYYCKEDRNGHPARASEWLATRLARAVDLPTVECAVVLDPDTGEEFFGSRQVELVADFFSVRDFLSRPNTDELGGHGAFPGQFLTELRTFDLFVDNPDRGPDNFVLVRDGLLTNLCPIDFASARLIECTTDGFPLETERTIFVGKLHQELHGSHPEFVEKMLEKLAAISVTTVRKILGEMPDLWLTVHQRGKIDEFWSDGRRDQRLKNLRAALSG